jgi:hypothetical protein
LTEKINTSKKEVRKFGLLFGVLAIAVGGYLLYRSNTMWVWLAGASAFFFISGLFATPILKPLYVVWMKFAFVLGWINTRILLGAFFFLILSPVAVVLRLLGKDPLDRRIDSSAKSYWKRKPREELDRARYERLF